MDEEFISLVIGAADLDISLGGPAVDVGISVTESDGWSDNIDDDDDDSVGASSLMPLARGMPRHLLANATNGTSSNSTNSTSGSNSTFAPQVAVYYSEVLLVA